MGYDFTSDERYQTDHSGSPVIDAKDKRIAELEALARETERHLCFSILAASPNRMGGDVPFKAHCEHAEALLAKVRALD